MRSSTSAFKEAVKTYNWKVIDIAVILAAIVLPELVLRNLVVGRLASPLGSVLSSLMPLLFAGIFNLWLWFSMFEIQNARFFHNELRIADVLVRSVKKVPRAIPIMIVVIIANVFGFALMLFPGLIAFVVFGYAYHVYYFDNEHELSALKYSARFVYDNGLDAVATVLIAGVVGLVGNYIVNLVFGNLSAHSIFLVTYFNGFIKAYCHLAVTEFYLRMRNEFSEEAVVNEM